jgi:hypothetical protein
MMKVVGMRKPATGSPSDFVRRASSIIDAANRICPVQKPRGFVFKAKTWDAYSNWKRSQANPRFW